jgi:nucleoside-diphosphate-sugar epimerase
MREDTKPTCWITGATGLIGSHVARELLARGHPVRALMRGPGCPDGVQAMPGDLTRPGWEGGLAGAEVAIHAAAVTQDWGHYARLRSLSLDVHRGLMAAVAGKVRRLILISATSVYGPGLSGMVREDQPVRLSGELCGDTKVEMEELAWRHHQAKHFELVIIRPVTCYGRGDRHFLPRLTRDLKERRSAWIGAGAFNANLCHAENVAQLVATAAVHPAAAGHAFHVADRAATSWRQVVEVLCRAGQAELPVRNIPVPLARGLARAANSIASWFSFRFPPPLTPHVVDILTSRATFSTERARDLLGFTPRWETAAGLQALVESGGP